LRQSNFELLRLVAIFLIATMHAMGQVFDTTSIVNRELIIFINSFANTGVSLFILISGYFGIKFKKERLFGIVGIVLFYSFLKFGVDTFVLGKHTEAKNLIPVLFPITGRRWWFISCYTVIYCLSPYINLIPEKLKQRDFKWLIAILLAFFFLAPTLLVFHEITDDMGKGVITMFVIYLVGRYIRLYGMPQIIKNHAWAIFVCCTIIVFAANSLLSLQGTVILRFARDNTVLILLSSLAVFHLFSKLLFSSSVINKLAGYVFGIYLCHFTIISVLEPLYAMHKNDMLLWPWLLLVLLVAYFGSIGVDAIRKFAIGRINALFNK